MKNSLEDRVARLEAVEEIRLLKYRYAALCDRQYDPDGLAGLFTPDGVWDGGDAYGTHRGRAEISAYWRSCAEAIPFAIHMIVNHIVEVIDPDLHATGSCHLFQPMTLEGEPHWAGVRYDEVYRRENGQWLFASVTLTTLLLARHREGW